MSQIFGSGHPLKNFAMSIHKYNDINLPEDFNYTLPGGKTEDKLKEAKILFTNLNTIMKILIIL